jgi:hypothetical protein
VAVEAGIYGTGGNAPPQAERPTVYQRLASAMDTLERGHALLDMMYNESNAVAPAGGVEGPLGVRELSARVEARAQSLVERLAHLQGDLGTV